MTSVNETTKNDDKYISLINNFTNKKSVTSNNLEMPQKTYNYRRSNINIINDSPLYNCLSEENNFPLKNQSPNRTVSEEEFYNTYNAKLQDTNKSNGMKNIKNNPNNLKEQLLYNEIYNNLNNNLNLNIPQKNNLDYKLTQLNAELNSINSDNVMLKEDIYKYTDINKYLESEIKIQKEHNNDLINTNDRLIEENNDLNEKLINDTNEFNELMEEKEKKQKEYDDKQKELEIKNIKINNDYDELLNINNKAKNDFNELCQIYDELNKKSIDTKNELNLLKELQNKHFYDIEEKINNIIAEINALKNEQNALNNEKNENKNKFELTKREKDDFFNKYQEQMLLKFVFIMYSLDYLHYFFNTSYLFMFFFNEKYNFA